MYKMSFRFSIMGHTKYTDIDNYNWENSLAREQEEAEREAREILESFSDEELISLLAEDGIIVEKQEGFVGEQNYSFTVPHTGGDYSTKTPSNSAAPNANSYPLAS